MINITVGSFKGGVGKSTLALNFAYELSKYYKVLLVDTDPQNSLAFFLCQEFKKGFSEILFEGENSEGLVKTPFLKENPNFYFLPTGVFCIKNPILYEDGFTVDLVRNFLTNISKFNFDFVVYDTPPRISKHIETLLNVSEDFLMVLNPDPATYSSLKIFLQFIQKSGIKSEIYTIINKTEPTLISEDFTRLIVAELNKKNILGILPKDKQVSESQGKCKPIIIYNPEAPFSIFLKKAVLSYINSKWRIQKIIYNVFTLFSRSKSW